ncbi:unnamed protein product [Calicophoron daubneyi]|uniref:Serine/threonine-protein kinase RIO1 n=1 Tax=Calicophoron daubneyi TaxID=300641 RepID=A0AAV2TKD6_CALDB
MSSSENESDDVLDIYEKLHFSDESEGENPTKLYMQRFQNKVDFSMKSERRIKDKSDRATTDHALDRRTCGILFKMMNQGRFTEISGCISTGKEANIYHVIDGMGKDLAVKVYMTSTMSFKSRDKYVKGDFRMRHGYSKATSWKQVSKWAEKEYRNLIRISQSKLIPCPIPLRLKGVILLMSFIGKDGLPAPRLKDAGLGSEDHEYSLPDWPRLYAQVVNDVRTLYQKCRLVHADLSEYNLLYFDGKVWMIDVSQSVEHESPQAMDYLRSDCHNVNIFFRKQGVPTLTLREFFEWVVDPSLPAPDDPATQTCLNKLLDSAKARGVDETIETEDNAFRYVYIPRSLFDGHNFTKDFLRLQRGELSPTEIYYAAVSGLKPDLSGAQAQLPEPEISDSDAEQEDSSSDEADAQPPSDGDRGEKELRNPLYFRPRNESPESRKLRKKLVKQRQADRRQTKTPKYIKRHKSKK